MLKLYRCNNRKTAYICDLGRGGYRYLGEEYGERGPWIYVNELTEDAKWSFEGSNFTKIFLRDLNSKELFYLTNLEYLRLR